MMSVLKEECNKAGLEMHAQKTQVMTNGINDLKDNRREVLKQFNEKQSEENKTKLLKKQQRNKNRKLTIGQQKEDKAAKESKKDKKKPTKKCKQGTSTKEDDAKNQKDQALINKLMLKDGTTIKILSPNEHVKYLGKMLNLINHTDKDIDERIRKGLIKFSEFQPQLCSKGVSRKKKWLLFESVITSTVLYGSCSWTMNSYRRAKLLSAQSKMVRQMMGLHWWKSSAKWAAEQ